MDVFEGNGVKIEDYSGSEDGFDEQGSPAFPFRPEELLDRNSLRYYGRPRRDMTNAFNAVKYQNMSLRGAATSFNVPESTLRDRVHGRVSLECSRPGPPTFFTSEEEKRMVDHILFMSKIGYPYTRSQVVELAGDMTKSVGRIAPFKYLNPSQAWFYAFLNRWPDLKNFLFGPRNNRKSRGVSGDSIQAYYEQLDKVLTKYHIKDKPDHIWVLDEVSVSCETQPPRTLPINIQRPQSTSYWNPSVAVLGAASASGDKVPAFLIYRAESVTNTMMQGSVKGTQFSTSNNGWITADMFLLWFVKHFKRSVYQRPVMLLYDGHMQFVSVRVLERAREEGVLLFPVPPHPAYNHCVENTCFCCFQQAFDRRLDKFLEAHPKHPLTKNNISPVITHAYEKALQPRKMVTLFEKLGVYPFNNLSSTIGAYMSMPDDPDMEALENASLLDETLLAAPTPQQQMPPPSHHRQHLPPPPQPQQQQQGRSSGLYSSMLEHIRQKYPNEYPEVVATGLSQANRPMTASQSLAISRAKARSDPKAQQPALISNRIQDYMGDRWANYQRNLNKHVRTTGATVKLAQRPSKESSRLPLNRVPSVAVCSQGNATPLHADALQQRQQQEGEGSLDSQEVGSESQSEEDEEPPDICAVCGRLEPPDLAAADEETQVVDWTKCGFCARWVHLNSQCSRGAAIRENDYMCRLCSRQSAAEPQPVEEAEAEEEAVWIDHHTESDDHVIQLD